MKYFLVFLLLHETHRDLIHATPCDPTDLEPPPCQCELGCNMSQARWRNKINIALNRPILCSAFPYQRCMVVNGITRDKDPLKWQGRTLNSCFRLSAPFKYPDPFYNGWILLTLDDIFYINHIVIWREPTEIGLKRMAGVEVRVDERPYHIFPHLYEMDKLYTEFYRAIEYHLYNPNPWTGKKVKLVKNRLTRGKNFSVELEWMQICEVQVLVCPKNHYGEDCRSTCDPERTKYTPCDPYKGAVIPPEPKAMSAESLVIMSSGRQMRKYLGQVWVDPRLRQHGDYCYKTDPQKDIRIWPWIRVFFERKVGIISVKIWSRADCCEDNLKDFVIRVGERDKDIYFWSLTAQRTGNLCYRHKGPVAQGAVIHVLCNNGFMMYGDHVTIVVPKVSPPRALSVCQILVYAVPILVLPPAGSGSCENCQLVYRPDCPKVRWSTTSERQGLELGDNCSSQSTPCIAGNALCDQGTCRLNYGGYCEGNANLCRRGSVCEEETCRLKAGDSCADSRYKTGQCPSGTSCKTDRCRGPAGFVCKGNSNACELGLVCDALLSVCKRPLGVACSAGTDVCPTGAVCNSTSFCQCNPNAATAVQTNECRPLRKKVMGSCTPSDGASACDDPNAACDLGKRKCLCIDGFTIHRSTLTCRVDAGGRCKTDADCNLQTTCQNSNSTHKTCNVRRGVSCVSAENHCENSTVCDDVSKTCLSDVGMQCSKSSDCRSKTTCAASLCQLKIGQSCAQHPSNCVPGSRCERGDNICKGLPGKSCKGTQETHTHTNVCVSGTVCDVDDICRVVSGQNCDSGDRKCRHGLVCQGGKCSVDLGRECTAPQSHCVNGTTCDNLKRCKISEGKKCSTNPDMCVSGSKCAKGVCQCIQGKSSPSGGRCEPSRKLPLGRCDPKQGNSACLDRQAECRNGTCRCSSGYTEDSADYSCKLAPGESCSFDGSWDKCTSGTTCGPDRRCGLELGAVCDPRRPEAPCRYGLVCQADGYCKIDLGGDCSGEGMSHCTDGTACDAQLRCRVPVGQECYGEGVCVAGARCDGVCTCIQNVSEAEGPLCLAKETHVGGKCGQNGPSACSDINAVCGDDRKCRCRDGYTMGQENLDCKLKLGMSCADNLQLCVPGTTCDPADHRCKLDVGQRCDRSKNEDCVSFAICDVSNRCNLDLQANCSGRYMEHCKIGTVCDNLFTCSIPEGDSCNSSQPQTTGSVKQCVAGATCDNSTCKCLSEVSTKSGILCLPESQFVSGYCDQVESPCYDPNAFCELTVCRCASGFKTTPSYSCAAEAGEQKKQRETLGIGAIVGGTVAALLLALGILLWQLNRAREGRARRTLTELKSQIEKEVLSLKEECSAVAEETSQTVQTVSEGASSAAHSDVRTSASGSTIASSVVR